MQRECISPGLPRDHSVYRYTDQIYKIVQFYSPRMKLGPGPKKEQKHYDEKLDASLCRSRKVILEKALCNRWDYFCTFTLSAGLVDRSDLASWWKRFSQWIRDERKKGLDISFLIVPEMHGDGSWHAHGLLSGIPDDQLISFRQMDKAGYRSPDGRRLPLKLRKSGYYNWPGYQQRFGFCSLGKIKDPVACGFYITKYITKDLNNMVKGVGLHTYYVSRGLQAATKHLDFYDRDPFVDSILVNKGEFCATGFTHVRDGLDWSFLLEYDTSQLEQLQFVSAPSGLELSPAQLEAEKYFSFEQIRFSDFL